MWRIIRQMPVMATIAAIVFLLVQTISSLYLPVVTADLVNIGVTGGDLPFIRRAGIMMIGLSVCSLAGAMVNTYISAKIAYRMGYQLRTDIYEKVLSFSRAEFDQFGSDTLLTRNTNDVTQVQTLIEMGLKFLILAPVYLVGGIILTWIMSPQLAIVFMITMPVLILAAVLIYRLTGPLYEQIQKLTDKLNLFFREGLIGVRVIRAFTREQQDYEKYRQVNEEYTAVSVKAGTIMSIFIPLITLIMNMTTIVLVWSGGQYVGGGTMEIGAVMAAVTYAAQILLGFQLIVGVVQVLPKGQVSAARIQEVLDTTVSVRDKTFATRKKEDNPALEFRNVSFRYSGAEQETLEDISFRGEPGAMIAIVGSTGAGKSTLMNLISRFYDVTEGCIKIGSKDICYIRQEILHQQVSFTPQKSLLFHGTIRSNLRMGRAGISDAEIWKALETAGAAEFVKALPEGLDAAVEKGGANFSGGQKQRLCIARTLLKKADIYIFDDSFSALDLKTDAQVRRAIKEELADALVLVVSQRINTVMDADQILVLDHGRLAGVGTHEELKQSNEIYKEMIRSQLDKEVAA